MARNAGKLLMLIAAVLIFAVLARLFAPAGVGERAVDPLGFAIEAVPADVVATGAGLGVLLLGSWLLGRVASTIGLSRITGYLVFGIICAPAMGRTLFGEGTEWVLSNDQRENLALVNDLAIALIALTAGGEIQLDYLKKSFKRISLILGFEFLAVLIAVGGLMTFMLWDNPVFAEYGGPITVVLVATVIGIVGTANSPAVVIAILGETGADGPMARTTLAVTVCKDLLLIVAFAVMLALATSSAMNAKAAALDDTGTPASALEEGQSLGAAIGAAESEGTAGDDAEGPGTAERARAGATAQGGGEPAGEPTKKAATSGAGDVAWKLTKQLGGSMVVGALIGLGLAWYVRNVNAHLPILLVLGSFAVALVSKELGLKTLIVGLSAGLTMANLYAKQAHELLERVEELAVPVYAIFFAVAGTKVDPVQLAGVWQFVLALVVLRTLSIWAGTGLGCKASGMEPPASRWIWTGFVPQAGISLALAVVVQEQFEDFAFSDKVFAILISAIAVHELVGPILFKFALGRAGESKAGGGGG